jgi:hypothetical protein
MDAVNGHQGSGNIFFNRFKYVHDLYSGNPSAALNQGIDLLNRCHAIDETAYKQIHKGSACYWLGIASFLVYEHELAAFFFDAAVTEDFRAGAHPVNNPTPALRFIQVEGDPQEQAARPLVQHTEARITELINDYNIRPGCLANIGELNLPLVREKFLQPAVLPGRDNWRSLATTLISYSLEWDFRNTLLDIRPLQGTAEPFFLHLFKGCVLFESLLKGNPTVPLPPNITTLGAALQNLHQLIGIPQNINIGHTDLPIILLELANADDSLQTAMQFAGRIRNTIGHNLEWVVDLNKQQYHRLFRMVSSSCLHAINSPY